MVVNESYKEDNFESTGDNVNKKMRKKKLRKTFSVYPINL